MNNAQNDTVLHRSMKVLRQSLTTLVIIRIDGRAGSHAISDKTVQCLVVGTFNQLCYNPPLLFLFSSTIGVLPTVPLPTLSFLFSCLAFLPANIGFIHVDSPQKHFNIPLSVGFPDTMHQMLSGFLSDTQQWFSYSRFCLRCNQLK